MSTEVRVPVPAPHLRVSWTDDLLAQALGRVPTEYVQGGGDLVGDALPSRVRRGPQLEVGRSVVGAVTVDVVDHLVVSQCSSQRACHHETVLQCVGLTADEPPFCRRDRHLPVPVAQRALTGDDADRLLRAGVTGRQEAPVVRVAQLPGVAWPIAVIDAAGPARSQRHLGPDVAVVAPALVVGVTPAPALGLTLTAVDGATARGGAADRAALAQPALVVHPAPAAGVVSSVAVVDRAVVLGHLEVLQPPPRVERGGVAAPAHRGRRL